VSDIGTDTHPIKVNTPITFISGPALKIGEAGRKSCSGNTIGFGAESHKKSPFANSTCGTKKY
jgi:hypothetical protein